jgi:hypothetical protein
MYGSVTKGGESPRKVCHLPNHQRTILDFSVISLFSASQPRIKARILINRKRPIGTQHLPRKDYKNLI